MNRFIEIAGAIGSQRHLVAIRDGFVAIMPLIIIGSFAVLLNNFPPIGFIDIVSFLNNIFGEGNWQTVGNVIWNATFAILGLLATFTIAYNLAISYEIDGLSAAIISAASYIMLVPITKDGGLNFEWLGAQGLFVGIIIALLVTELFKVLVRSKWTIKMPEGVPYGVVRSFEALVPASLILVIIGIFQALITVFIGMSIFEVIFNAIQEPLQGLGNTLPAAIIISLSNHVLWFFGLHGTNIIGSIIEPLYLPLIEENMNAFNSGISAFEVPYIVTKPFLDAFVLMGGSGTTIALIIAIFIVIRSHKNHPYKKVAGLSAPASVFNINEPIIFGLPIVLNPAMLIPFILIPVILTVISYLALDFGLVPKTVAIIPWTTPPILSGYLVTGGSWQGIALQVVNIIIAVLLYIPFVYSGYKAMNKEMEDNKNVH